MLILSDTCGLFCISCPYFTFFCMSQGLEMQATSQAVIIILLKRHRHNPAEGYTFPSLHSVLYFNSNLPLKRPVYYKPAHPKELPWHYNLGRQLPLTWSVIFILVVLYSPLLVLLPGNVIMSCTNALPVHWSYADTISVPIVARSAPDSTEDLSRALLSILSH